MHELMTIPRPGRRARWAAILTGLSVFLWLGPEDNHVWSAALMGALVSFVVLAHWVMGRFGGQTLQPRQIILWAGVFGSLAGLGASVLTALLMVLKDVRHAHIFPDYPPGLLLAMLSRAPFWALAGGLIGLSVGLAWRAVRKNE